MTEMPDDVRVPLHELQADVDYLIGRVIADASCASTIAASIKGKLTAIEAAILSGAPAQPARDALVKAEAALEGIRLILVNHLEEPERSAFWKAVTARDTIRAALVSQPSPAATVGTTIMEATRAQHTIPNMEGRPAQFTHNGKLEICQCRDCRALSRSSAVSERAEVSSVPMALSDGRTDYFVQIKVGDRAVTPHVFREEYKSAYHVALYDWLLNGSGEEPDCIEFGPDDWPGRVMPAVPQAVGMRDTMIRGMQAAFDEVAEYLEQQNAGGFAAHIRRRSVSLSRPQSECK